MSLLLRTLGIVSADANSAGSSTSAVLAAAVWAIVAVSAGVSTVQANSGSINKVDASSQGVSVVTGVSGSINKVDANAAGTSVPAATGAAIWDTQGSSIGTSVPSGVGAAIWRVDFSAQGTSPVSGIGAALWDSLGSSAGTSVAAGVGRAVWDGLASCAGLSTAAAPSNAIWAALANSAGTSTVTGLTSAIAGGSTASAGSSTPQGAGASIWDVVADSDGTGSALGDGEDGQAGSTIVEADGSASGTSTVTGVSGATAQVQASAQGTSQVLGQGADANFVLRPVTTYPAVAADRDYQATGEPTALMALAVEADYHAGAQDDGLMTPVRRNYVAWSEEPNQPAIGGHGWVKSDLTVTPNTIIAPDGTLTADKLVEGAGTVYPSVYFDGHGIPDSSQAVASIHCKAGERSTFQMDVYDNVNAYAIVDFTLAGTGLATLNPLTVSPAPTFGIEALPDDWYRCWIHLPMDTASPGVNLVQADLYFENAAPYAGDGVSGFYIWGAQFEVGSVPTAYIKTEADPVTIVDPAGAYQAPAASTTFLARRT